jgi:hypothetical protein
MVVAPAVDDIPKLSPPETIVPERAADPDAASEWLIAVLALPLTLQHAGYSPVPSTINNRIGKHPGSTTTTAHNPGHTRYTIKRTGNNSEGTNK